MLPSIRALKLFKEKGILSRDEKLEAKTYLRLLAEYGFTDEEIWFFTPWWKVSTIRKYRKGVEVKHLDEKNRILGLVEDYSETRDSWEEFEYFTAKNKLLEDKGRSIEDVLRIDEETAFYKIDYSQFLSVTEYLKKVEGGWIWMMNQINLLIHLFELGYTVDSLESIAEKTQQIGIDHVLINIQKEIFLYSVKEYERKHEQRMSLLDSQVMEKKSDLRDLELKAKTIQSYINIVAVLIGVYNFDLNAFKTILELAAKAGQPIIVLDAINRYTNLKELEEVLAKTISAIETNNQSIKDLEAKRSILDEEVNKIYIKIGEIDEKYRNTLSLRNIASLLDSPNTTDLDPNTFMWLSQTLLTSMLQYGMSHGRSLPKWSTYIHTYVDNAAQNLTNIVNGKL